MDRVGFEPTKPEARDLQSPVIDQLYDLSKNWKLNTAKVAVTYRR